MTLDPKSFLYDLDDASGVATITLARPDRLNALTFEVYRELRETFLALDTEPGCARSCSPARARRSVRAAT